MAPEALVLAPEAFLELLVQILLWVPLHRLEVAAEGVQTVTAETEALAAEVLVRRPLVAQETLHQHLPAKETMVLAAVVVPELQMVEVVGAHLRRELLGRHHQMRLETVVQVRHLLLLAGQ